MQNSNYHACTGIMSAGNYGPAVRIHGTRNVDPMGGVRETLTGYFVLGRVGSWGGLAQISVVVVFVSPPPGVPGTAKPEAQELKQKSLNYFLVKASVVSR